MKKLSSWIILLACSSFIILHFYNLSHYLINFPTWGDDILFLAYFTDLPKLHGLELWNRTVEFHSMIHRFPVARILTASYAQFSRVFDFKELTILANFCLISVIYPIYQYIEKAQIKYWHLIALVGLLFAANGNLDNFALIGVLQHTTAIVFLIWLAYWISHEKTRKWGIWISLAYPLFSTEGLAFFPLVFLLLIYLKDSKWWLYGLLAGLVIYLYFLGYQAPSTISSSGNSLTKILLAAKGAILFAGGAIKKNFAVASLMGILFSANVLWLAWRYHQTKNPALLFSTLIFIQLMAVGAMVALGRASESGDLIVLFSERFSTYGTVYLVISYFSLIQADLYPFKWNRSWLLLPAMIWIGLSHYYAEAKLENLHNRLLADASNAYHFNVNTNYGYGKREKYLFKDAGTYQFPSGLLKTHLKETPNIQLKAMPAYEKGIREYNTDQNGVLLVFQSKKPSYFLAINSLSHSVKIKEDVPYDERTSSFALIR